MVLSITYSKLARFCEHNGGYDLHRSGSAVSLSFTPNFPEAIEKGESVLPRVHMSGIMKKARVQFTHFEMEDAKGTRARKVEEAEMVYKGWLDYIEENF